MRCIKNCWCKTLEGKRMRTEPINSERVVWQNALRDIVTLQKQVAAIQQEFSQREQCLKNKVGQLSCALDFTIKQNAKHSATLENRVNHLETLVMNYRSIIDSLSVTTNELMISNFKHNHCLANCNCK